MRGVKAALFVCTLSILLPALHKEVANTCLCNGVCHFQNPERARLSLSALPVEVT